ncbi:MAG TPA: indole-3-glycerol phosphate synthase TrpC [Gemmatimonadales bacterium]|nr:indole-3-glycerol phosphate synthase TrpC [Gemmatimonadales bacterium]
MPVTLDQILRSTRSQLARLRDRQASLEREAQSGGAPPSFRAALRKSTVGVIAEVKRRSPSAGSICENLDPAGRAALYAAHGAAAISVLTDGPYFGGSIGDLIAASKCVSVPVLRKDFILDEIQVLEARAAGAAAVLLIVRAVGPRLGPLLRYAAGLRLDALVEVHTMDELASALDAGATVIGVNSRDLDTFSIDTKAALTIVSRVPHDCIAVAESGMVGESDVVRAAEAGADAVLIGTALSAAASPERLLELITGVPRRGR